MSGWFPSVCPVDPVAKVWIEERLIWLSEQFPSSAFADNPVVLPTSEFFPDRFDDSDESLRALLDRVCGYMGVAGGCVDLKLFPAAKPLWLVNESGKSLPSDAAGTSEERPGYFVIRISEGQLGNLAGLVGTIAHELAHVRLLGEGRISHDAFDQKLLTDLTVVHHGMGIFLANSPRHWDGHYTRWPITNLKKPEYMTPPMFGYALAHLAWFRNESKPAWARYLSLSARANLKQGLRFLQQTGESAYQPRHARLGRAQRPT